MHKTSEGDSAWKYNERLLCKLMYADVSFSEIQGVKAFFKYRWFIHCSEIGREYASKI